MGLEDLVEDVSFLFSTGLSSACCSHHHEPALELWGLIYRNNTVLFLAMRPVYKMAGWWF